MKLQVVRLNCRPGSQFHLGENISFQDAVLHKSSSYIHSDTLYAAFVNISNKLAIPSPENVLSDCRISSAFYTITKKEKSVYFLPRINVPLSGTDNFKEIKRLSFASAGVYKTGIPLNKWLSESDFIIGKNWIATKAEFTGWELDYKHIQHLELYQLLNRPQVKVHSSSTSGNFYQSENLHIADNRHLDNDINVSFYFLIQGELTATLKNVMNWLPFEGIGGQVSTGCGQIDSIEFLDASPFDLSREQKQYINLSLLSPAREDNLHTAYYRLKKRGGRHIKESWYLKELLMIEEGAVFQVQVEGTVQDITPENYDASRYYRYGKSFLLNLPPNMI